MSLNPAAYARWYSVAWKRRLLLEPRRVDTVAYFMAVYADKNGEARPKITTIAAETGLNSNTVWKAISRLRELGYCDVVGRRTGRNVYRINSPSGGEYDAAQMGESVSPSEGDSDTPSGGEHITDHLTDQRTEGYATRERVATPKWISDIENAVNAILKRSMRQLTTDERSALARFHCLRFGRQRTEASVQGKAIKVAKSFGQMARSGSFEDLSVAQYIRYSEKVDKQIGGRAWMNPWDIEAVVEWGAAQTPSSAWNDAFIAELRPAEPQYP